MSNEIEQLKDPYFDLQAELGVTKHLGGLEATRELLALCHVATAARVLVVGCGVGATVCHIARHYDCTVAGVDISQRMIDRSNERAQRLGLTARTEFLVADILDLPFEAGLFDAVISESVTAFVDDKARAVREYARVTNPGGYVGLTETTWMEPNPPADVVEYASRAMGGIVPETADGWAVLLQGAGLCDVVQKAYRITYLRQFVNEMKMTSFSESARAWGRLIALYFKGPAYRAAIRQMQRDARRIPKHMFTWMGYGVYVGRR